MKKTELTRVESQALSVAQWCIIELLSEKDKNRNVFFTQVNVSTVPTKKLSYGISLLATNYTECKAIKLKAHFTTLAEFMACGREGYPPERPFIELDILFYNTGAGCFVWEALAFGAKVSHFNDIVQSPFVCYSKLSFEVAPMLKSSPQRTERFEQFSGLLSKAAPWGVFVINDK